MEHRDAQKVTQTHVLDYQSDSPRDKYAHCTYIRPTLTYLDSFV